MIDKIRDRRTFILIIFSLIFLTLIFRLAQITIAEGDKFSKKALDLRLKKVTSIARRGEIYDRNNKLLAGNGTSLYLEYVYNYMPKEDFEKMAIRLFKLLDEQDEKHIMLPILLEDGKFIYKSDKDKLAWLAKMNLAPETTAREAFDYFCLREGIAKELDTFSAQQLLIAKGFYLPLGVEEERGRPKVTFLQDGERYNFLESYDFDPKLDAKSAFKKLREYYGITESLSDEEAYDVMILRHYVRNLGYLKYEPIEICDRISEETSLLITERLVDFPDVSVGVKPFRYYPLKNTCSHILGYLGPISTKEEAEKYNDAEGYDHRDLIGKIGIEASYEAVLHGKRGVKWIDSDSSGEATGAVSGKYGDSRFKDVRPISGKDIQLTIDSDFQKRIEGYLTKLLDVLQTNDRYVSKYENVIFDKPYPFARTGAVVVVDVESSEVLAMVSKPDYDVNLFTGGISVEDWLSLQPDNNNDPLGPKPMYNIATMTAVQPGSTFKIVTGFAALQQGLDPYRRINTRGNIVMPDGTAFGCWIWNYYGGGAHGPINLMEAIAVSCNYYFYCLGSGYDYGSEQPLEVDMGPEKVVEAARTFGLGEASGVEVDELVTGVPDHETKKNLIVSSIRDKMYEIADDYLPPSIATNRQLLEDKIKKLTDYGLSHSDAPRYEVLDFLQELFEIQDIDKLNELTDTIKYDYFAQMGSFDSDAFNLAIGQGRNEYTPVQMARYITTIANGGYLQKLTLIKSVGGEPAEREPFKKIDDKGLIKYLQMGMNAAVSDISYGSYFSNFPMEIALKTGTAEREGKVSKLNEVEYLEEYASSITDVPLSQIKERASEIMKERSLKIGKIYTEMDAEKDEFKLKKLKEELSNYKLDSYLDLGNAMREAIKELSSDLITDEMIDRYKANYDNFAWLVAYAPYDKPKIAVAIMLPQAGSGLYCFPLLKDILTDYFKL